MTTNNDDTREEFLSLCDIASWQVDNSLLNKVKSERKIVAVLPSMQRGAVWKPSQIEPLWDSITRGFPIGSFLISEYDSTKGIQKSQHQDEKPDKNRLLHDGQQIVHLLDGQQRSNAIALGFVNPWEKDVD